MQRSKSGMKQTNATIKQTMQLKFPENVFSDMYLDNSFCFFLLVELRSLDLVIGERVSICESYNVLCKILCMHVVKEENTTFQLLYLLIKHSCQDQFMPNLLFALFKSAAYYSFTVITNNVRRRQVTDPRDHSPV